jgi:signal transduction histidine kinase/FixJ family two-component response regulator
MSPVSPPRPLDLVVVEDSEDDYLLVVTRLASAGWEVRPVRVETAAELQAALAARRIDAVISDHQLPRFGSMAALALVRSIDPDMPFVLVSGAIGEEVAVGAMQAGADDYVMKDNLGRLVPGLAHALEAGAARRRHRAAESALVESEARFRALADNLPGVVFQLQFDGDRQQLVYVSDAGAQLFGDPIERLLHGPVAFTDRFAPESAASLRPLLAARAGGFEPLRWVGALPPIPGRGALWVELAASPRRLASGRIQWDGILTDITAQKDAELALMDSRTELRELASHLARVREEEREAIAREIHDDVGSTLMAVKFDVAFLKGQLRQDAATTAKLVELDQLVDVAILSSSRIMHDLRPGILDEGIVAALEWQARDFQHRMGIACGFAASADEIPVDRATAIAAFRICQEALSNVAKYAAASRVDVRLDGERGELRMTIHDNGKGIHPADLAKPDCFGLRGMKERAVSLGGSVAVTGGPGRGTTITLTLPIADPAAADDKGSQ